MFSLTHVIKVFIEAVKFLSKAKVPGYAQSGNGPQAFFNQQMIQNLINQQMDEINRQQADEINRQQLELEKQQAIDWHINESMKSVMPFEHGGYDMTQGNSFNQGCGGMF